MDVCLSGIGKDKVRVQLGGIIQQSNSAIEFVKVLKGPTSVLTLSGSQEKIVGLKIVRRPGVENSPFRF